MQQRLNAPPVTPTLPTTTTDIYVAGDTTAPNGKTVAVYWKNNNANSLTDGSSNAEIKSMTISVNIFIWQAIGKTR